MPFSTKFIPFFLFLSVSASHSSIKNIDDFPTPILNLESENFLFSLNSELGKTLTKEIQTDDELQYLDSGSGSGQEPQTQNILIPSTTTTTSSTMTPTIATTVETTTLNSLKAQPTACIPLRDCYEDKECPNGKCFGSELGICDCNACIANAKCSSDLSCGGLRNSCDSSTGLCDCVKAFHSHGYQLFVKVLLTFCHQTKCTSTSDNCFGLPCRTGKCKCSSVQNSNQPIHYFTG